LYVGSLIFDPSPGSRVHEEIAEEIGRIEVVTGSEAERLIAKIYRSKSSSWLAEQRKLAAEHHREAARRRM
jgi:hypothetical protein